MSAPPWTLQPDDPRAPSDEVWAQLSPEQRREVEDSLPSYVPPEFLDMQPEGDPHGRPIADVVDTLGRYFRKQGRDVYIGRDLLVYYPEERVFAPDIFVVLDVSSEPRWRWTVQKERRGLDIAIEVLVRGDVSKDLKLNVARYARLGIPEYFVYEPTRQHLHAFRLEPGASAYTPVMPQAGRFHSEVLGLELILSQDRMHFFAGELALPNSGEVEKTLNRYLGEVHERAETELQRRLEAERRAEEEAKRAEEEAKRAAAEHAGRLAAEARLAEALRRIQDLEGAGLTGAKQSAE